MKKLLIILGGIFAVILVVMGIAAAIFIPPLFKLDRSATAYIQATVPQVVAHWNSQDLLDRATPQLLSAVKPRDKLDRLFVMFRQLGSLKQLATPKGAVTTSSFTDTGTVTLGNYTVQADFEKGKASIQIQLRRVDDTWKINGFRINSDVFLPSKE